MRAKVWVALAGLLCVGAVVVSAAAAPPAGIERDPVGTAIFANWYTDSPGAWFTVLDDLGHKSGYSTAPITTSTPVLIDVIWAGQGYGHTKAVPGVDQLKLTITKDGDPFKSQTWAQGQAAWTNVFGWDSYWETLVGPVPPFNAHMGIGTYGIKWANNLGTLAAGRYHVVIDEMFKHVYNDLSFYSGDWKKPTKFAPYTASYEFDIVVQ